MQLLRPGESTHDRSWQPSEYIAGSLSNSPEKSALSLAYILSHDIPAGSIVGPDKGLGGWGYPEVNHVGRRVKEGAEELIRFTDLEIEKARAHVPTDNSEWR